MMRIAFPLLALVSVVLIGVVARELLDEGYDAVLVSAAKTTPPQPEPRRRAFRDNAAAYLAEILARPLFAVDRRPPERGARAAGMNAKAGPLKARLAGVVVGPDTREALFMESGKTKATVLHEGDDIGGWLVESIGSRHVALRAGGQSEILEPVADKRPTAGQAGPFVASPAAREAVSPPLSRREP